MTVNETVPDGRHLVTEHIILYVKIVTDVVFQNKLLNFKLSGVAGCIPLKNPLP